MAGSSGPVQHTALWFCSCMNTSRCKTVSNQIWAWCLLYCSMRIPQLEGWHLSEEVYRRIVQLIFLFSMFNNDLMKLVRDNTETVFSWAESKQEMAEINILLFDYVCLYLFDQLSQAQMAIWNGHRSLNIQSRHFLEFKLGFLFLFCIDWNVCVFYLICVKTRCTLSCGLSGAERIVQIVNIFSIPPLISASAPEHGQCFHTGTVRGHTLWACVSERGLFSQS